MNTLQNYKIINNCKLIINFIRITSLEGLCQFSMFEKRILQQSVLLVLQVKKITYKLDNLCEV